MLGIQTAALGHTRHDAVVGGPCSGWDEGIGFIAITVVLTTKFSGEYIKYRFSFYRDSRRNDIQYSRESSERVVRELSEQSQEQDRMIARRDEWISGPSVTKLVAEDDDLTELKVQQRAYATTLDLVGSAVAGGEGRRQ